MRKNKINPTAYWLGAVGVGFVTWIAVATGVIAAGWAMIHGMSPIAIGLYGLSVFAIVAGIAIVRLLAIVADNADSE